MFFCGGATAAGLVCVMLVIFAGVILIQVEEEF